MDKVSLQMSHVQHKERFIATFLLHNLIPFMHKNIVSQTEDLEIEMKLESSLIGKTSTWMMHIQLQLDTIIVQLQDIKKWKEF